MFHSIGQLEADNPFKMQREQLENAHQSTNKKTIIHLPQLVPFLHYDRLLKPLVLPNGKVENHCEE
ncbi:hypothetical protein HanRHA438_Chr11g0518111 [Helianthus annuus]|nr:hypothetical protein HanRHA438_Chr11g0518111 [Helianthus annuus]